MQEFLAVLKELNDASDDMHRLLDDGADVPPKEHIAKEERWLEAMEAADEILARRVPMALLPEDVAQNLFKALNDIREALTPSRCEDEAVEAAEEADDIARKVMAWYAGVLGPRTVNPDERTVVIAIKGVAHDESANVSWAFDPPMDAEGDNFNNAVGSIAFQLLRSLKEDNDEVPAEQTEEVAEA